jgi:hypothetical protein
MLIAAEMASGGGYCFILRYMEMAVSTYDHFLWGASRRMLTILAHLVTADKEPVDQQEGKYQQSNF